MSDYPNHLSSLKIIIDFSTTFNIRELRVENLEVRNLELEIK